MKRSTVGHSGFTLFETLLAMTIVSLVSVTSVYILFLSLNLRDLTLATTQTEESMRIFNRQLRQAVIGAKSVTGGSDSIFTRSQTECWSFVYDPLSKNIKYSELKQEGCTPDPDPSTLFFPSSSKINSIAFTISDISTGGRLVGVTGTIQTTLPFDTYQTTFSESYVNLID
ncbi:MAG: hypothetical protein ACD_61C00105G0002 [uncultured bacterium]|nr:MAG: hypothetical protein ACD_61C00105G0002 [uncultured bacterium]